MVGATERGRRISAAKKGVRQLDLAEDELILTEAVREKLASYEELREGVDSGPEGGDGEPWLRHRTEPVPGGRRATIFSREPLKEDLATMRRELGGTKRARGARARRRKKRSPLTASGAVPLVDAAKARDLIPDTLGTWVRRGHSRSAFRGPRGTVWFRSDHELDAELEHFRCAKEGCDRYALLSASGRCMIHDAYVDRDGRLTATEFAERHGVRSPALVARLESGEIPGDRVDRGGRACGRDGWLIDEPAALAVLDEYFRCAKDGCLGYALGPSAYCIRHAGGAAKASMAAERRVMVVCSQCGSRRWYSPSKVPAGSLCHECNLASEEFDRLRREAVASVWADRYAVVASRESDGLVPIPALAADLGLARTSAGAVVPHLGVAHERLTVRGTEFVLADLADAARRRRDQLREGGGQVRAAQSLKHETRRLRAAGLLTTLDQLADLERRIEIRCQWMRRLSPGAPPKPPPPHYLTWQREFLELRDYYERLECAGESRPADEQLIVEAAQVVAQLHPHVFDYDPAHPRFRKNVAARGRAALKSLQNQENGN